jgi:hypothetical protein
MISLDSLYVPSTGPNKYNSSYWQPNSGLNNAIRKQEGIKSNWSYRQFMTNHALGIMNYNTNQAQKSFGLPITFNSNKTIESFNSNSDLKNAYVSKEKIQSKMVSPSII